MPHPPGDDPPSTGRSGVPLRVAGVRHVYSGGVHALERIDLDVAGGEFLAILGPSGCGKSTLLRLIAGLERPSEGAVAFGEATETPHMSTPADIAYVFQDAHLLPWRTVLDNAALPLELAGVGRAERRERAASELARVGLGEFLGRYPVQLSGGMRMRVSLARAMVTQPRLLLLDEPFAALDEITRQRLDEQLRELWQASGMTVLFVTHSIAEAVFLAERAMVMSRRPGRIVLDRRIELPSERVAELRTSAAFANQTRDLFEALREESEKTV